MKRSRPALHLSRSPLVLVIGQVKISSVASMERFVPDIQERLRKRGFPKFFADDVEEITLRFGPAQQQRQVELVKRWAFHDKASTWEIQLDTETVTVMTSAYDRYDTSFEDNLMLALSTVHDVVGLELVTRVGLRYVDLIRVAEGEKFSDYLDPRLLGLDPDEVGVKSMLTRFHGVARSDAGLLAIRCAQMNDGSHLPPDLRPSRLTFDKSVREGETVCFLDLDHFSEAQRDFDVDGILRLMGDELHDTLDITFRSAVTEHAMTQWGASEVK